MCHETTMKIKSYSHDAMMQDSLCALMDYYQVNNLLHVSEEMGLAFLAKLESGEIRIPKGV